MTFGRFLSEKWPQQLAVEDRVYAPAALIERFQPLITEHRMQKILKVAADRSQSFVPVLENIYDRGNISAVMRSAEAFGFYEIHIIEKGVKFKESARVSQGADKWLNIYRWRSTADALSYLKDQGAQIYATHLSKESKQIKDIEMSKDSSVALIFGNEKDGVTDEALSFCDGNILVPMRGFTQSFNISVAAALCLQEAAKVATPVNAKVQQGLVASYILKSLDLSDSQLDKIMQT